MMGIDYAMVRRSVAMSRVLELLGFTPVRRGGKQLRGPCPVHRSGSPQSRSFSVNLATNAFRCFTCGACGNQLDLWRQVHGLTLYDAALDLCHRAQVPVPWFGSPVDKNASRVKSEKRIAPRKFGKGGSYEQHVTETFRWNPAGEKPVRESLTSARKRVLRGGRVTGPAKRRQRVRKPCY